MLNKENKRLLKLKERNLLGSGEKHSGSASAKVSKLRLKIIMQLLFCFIYFSMPMMWVYDSFVVRYINLFIYWILQSNKRKSSPKSSSPIVREIDFEDVDTVRTPLSPLQANSPDSRMNKKWCYLCHWWRPIWFFRVKNQILFRIDKQISCMILVDHSSTE